MKYIKFTTTDGLAHYINLTNCLEINTRDVTDSPKEKHPFKISFKYSEDDIREFGCVTKTQREYILSQIEELTECEEIDATDPGETKAAEKSLEKLNDPDYDPMDVLNSIGDKN